MLCVGIVSSVLGQFQCVGLDLFCSGHPAQASDCMALRPGSLQLVCHSVCLCVLVFTYGPHASLIEGEG